MSYTEFIAYLHYGEYVFWISAVKLYFFLKFFVWASMVLSKPSKSIP